MKKIVLILAFLSLAVILAIGTLSRKESEASTLMTLKERYTRKHVPSVNHAAFPSLQKSFATPQQVTAACIACHNQRHTEIMQSNHWNWEREEYIKGRGVVYLGKKNAINNFCIGTRGNERSCAKCHIGYGMDAQGKVFTDSTNIDCLVCHDNTDTYVKAPEMGGAPVSTLDLKAIAEHIGRPRRANCGVCHFYGGGGNNVKHGDLEMSMFEPAQSTDVHMGTDGLNMVCVDCHRTEKHVIAGKLYSLASTNQHRATCEQCHTETPHMDDILNEHTLKVACQSCHIPTYAKDNATKMFWDWSTAGRLKNGQPFVEEDSMGNHAYMSIKGSFRWARNVTPDYVWFNGTASHYLLGDQVQDTTRTLVLNQLHGAYADASSKIVPVKIHMARQPFDPVNRMLIQPKLYADKTGEGAFWKDFDWNTAAATGMKDVGLPFSGKISFIATSMYWPVNHMVASKQATVTCNECHTRKGGRLANLTDFYMPGRDYSGLVETGGTWLLILTLGGVLLHGSIRVILAVRTGKRGGQ
jgi:octaheme c-type cytochrome (tetrathionate reductase family)